MTPLDPSELDREDSEFIELRQSLIDAPDHATRELVLAWVHNEGLDCIHLWKLRAVLKDIRGG